MPAAIPTPTTLKGLVEQAKPPEGPEIKDEAKDKSEEEDSAVMLVIRRREVIKLVSCMNATVGAKTAEQGLLRYRTIRIQTDLLERSFLAASVFSALSFFGRREKKACLCIVQLA